MPRSWTALALVGLLAACAQDDPEEMLPTDSAAIGRSATPGPLTDAQMAHLVMVVNTADSAGGERARTNARDAAVQAFAQRMVQDHGAANQQLAQLGLGHEESDLSGQLQSLHDAATQRLQGVSGAAFDRSYIDHEVTMHQTALELLDQRLIPHAQHAQLAQLLQLIRTTVQSHLEQAQQIQSQLGSAQDTATTTGE